MDGELRDLERAGCEALADSGEAAQAFYGRLLTDDALMIFPGMVLDGKSTILESMAGPPWAEYAIRELDVRPLGTDSAVVTYAASARREHQDALHAHCTSVYVRTRGSPPVWRLALHQQTPA